MRTAWRRLRTLLVPLAFLIALAACRVEATVTVRMRENGSGIVSLRVVLDRAAVRAAEIGNGKLEQRVRLDDLPSAGWTVTPWKRDADGGATLMIRKRFSGPREVAGIVREINGTDGPLRAFSASRTSSTFVTHWKVDGGVDLRLPRVGVATDPQLVAKLTAERVDIPQIESRLASAMKGVRVHLVAELPDADRREVVAAIGGDAVLRESSQNTDVNRLLMLVGGLALAVIAIMLFVLGELRARRRTRRNKPSRRPDDIAHEPQ